MASLPASLALICLVLFVLFKLSSATKLALFSEFRHIPGPFHARWSNLGLKLRVIQGQRTQYIHVLHQRYGHFVRISPTEVSISDLKAFRIIHRAGSGFNKSEWYKKFSDGSVPGIFGMTDPKQHAQRRRLFASGFSNTAILKFEIIVRGKVKLAVAKIKRDAAAASADILKWFTFMATDVASQLSFGKSFEMLEKEEKNQYIKDLELIMMMLGIKAETGPLFTIAKWLPIPALQQVLNLHTRQDLHAANAIRDHRASVSGKEGSDAVSIFARFFDRSKNQELDDDEIAREAANLTAAASDTTAVSLTYLIYMVLHPNNQRIKEELLREIDRMPSDASASELGSLRYLRAVIDESLRLYGAAPASLPRMVPAGGASLGGHSLPAGTTVSTQAFTIHRDPTIFEDPESFRPERWMNPTQDMKDAFHPFGAGTRICIGLHLAMLELTLGTFEFFKRCPSAVLSKSTTEESMEIENYFLIAPKSHQCEISL